MNSFEQLLIVLQIIYYIILILKELGEPPYGYHYKTAPTLCQSYFYTKITP